MARIGDGGDLLKCSFCGKSQKQVKKLIAGPGVYICDECIDLCNEIIEEELSEGTEVGLEELPKPREIYEFLNGYVDRPGRPPRSRSRSRSTTTTSGSRPASASAASGTAKDEPVELAKSNILLIGPTGCGKTYLAQTLARMLNVPFAIADATALTEAGYVGEDVENILLKLIQAADYDVKKAETGHHLHRRDRQGRPQGGEPVDHPRRLRRGRAAGAAEDPRGHDRLGAAAGWPQAPAPGVHPDRHDEHPVHRRRRVRRPRAHRRAAGRQEDARLQRRAADQGGARHRRRSSPRCMPEDLLKFGLIPEFVGRLPVIATVDKLNREALIRILTEPRNALVKQYQKLFELDNVELEFTDDAIEAIADLAMLRGTGARGPARDHRGGAPPRDVRRAVPRGHRQGRRHRRGRPRQRQPDAGPARARGEEEEVGVAHLSLGSGRDRRSRTPVPAHRRLGGLAGRPAATASSTRPVGWSTCSRPGRLTPRPR